MSEEWEKLNGFLNCISDILASKVMTRLDSLIDHKVNAMRTTIKKMKGRATKTKIIFDVCAQMKRAFTSKDIYSLLQTLQQNEYKNKEITKDYVSGQIWAFAQKDILTLVKKGHGKNNPNIYIFNRGEA